MALHLKIGKSAYDALPDAVKKEYKAEGSDYTLDLEGYEDPAEIRRARDNANEERNNAKRERDAHKRDLDAANRKVKDLEDAGKSVDDAVKAKDTEWQTRYDKDIQERDGKITAFQTGSVKRAREAAADTLANKIATSPKLLTPHLLSRLDAEYDEKSGETKLFILDGAGKRTAGTIEDLEKETLKDRDLAPILRGTRGNGGGGAPPAPGGGGAPRHTPQPGTAHPDLTKIDPKDFAASIREQRIAAGKEN